MSSLLTHVLATIRRHDLLPAGSRVIAGVSGGADSVALLHLLRLLAGAGSFALVGVAHLHHRLRGEPADEDERFCRSLASELGLAFHADSVDVQALARQRRTSIEHAGRSARLDFFDRAACRAGADRVAVGHTRDDQAETFVLRLLRGAGPRGLAGIYPRRGLIVRPLLDVSRTQLRAFLGARGIPFRDDATNRDVGIPRNRIRHELMPYLRCHLSPGIATVLSREATIAREDADWLESAAAQAVREVVLVQAEHVSIDVAGLRNLPPAMARRVARRAMEMVAPGRFIGFDHVAALLALVDGRPGRIALPGQQAARARDRLVLSPQAGRPARRPARAGGFIYTLSIPGEVRVAEAAMVLSAERAAAAEVPAGSWISSRGGRVAVDGSTLTGPLTVRSRQAGDRFRPLGLRGHKSLQDFFVDRKIVREERDRVPLVIDPRGRIVWIVGQAVADDFRVTGRTKSVILLTARQLGGVV